MKKRVAILTGGTSSEREIALRSAAAVKNALGDRFVISLYDLPNDLDKFLSEYRSIEAVIPVFHGRGGEDGSVQSTLNTLGVKFIFSDVEAHATAFNKALTKTVVEKTGVKIPEGKVVSDGDDIAFSGPVVVKPVDSGSSIGVSIVKDATGLKRALDNAFKESSDVLIEDFIEGDEYTVAVIETESGVTALPVIAIKPKTEFFDLQSKYDPALCDEICPAPISAALTSELQAAALAAHRAIGARHISRSDFIVDTSGRVWFLEINTIPGMTANSLLPKALKVAGIDFGDLLALWIEKL